jgi:hypothetical protein
VRRAQAQSELASQGRTNAACQGVNQTPFRQGQKFNRFGSTAGTDSHQNKPFKSKDCQRVAYEECQAAYLQAEALRQQEMWMKLYAPQQDGWMVSFDEPHPPVPQPAVGHSCPKLDTMVPLGLEHALKFIYADKPIVDQQQRQQRSGESVESHDACERLLSFLT